uniref:hypothetical protein n=1 Tax=Prevotella sp. TaxID=59823 RepID=UPI003FEEE27D
MKRKLMIALINVVLGLFAIYYSFFIRREAFIASHHNFIACQIIQLYPKSGSRTHPTARVIYHGKEYFTNIRSGENLNIGYNDTTFHYDPLFDKVFCRNQRADKGIPLVFLLFLSSFLLWIDPSVKRSKARPKTQVLECNQNKTTK